MMRFKQAAAIVDLDGTLCINDHRRHFMQQKPKDRDSFHGGLLGDTCRQQIRYFLEDYRQDGQIIIITGRPIRYQPWTEEWLRRERVSYDELYMRADGDCREDYVVKEEIYQRYVEPYYKVDLVFEDKDSVVKMWRSLGLECWQVADGSYG